MASSDGAKEWISPLDASILKKKQEKAAALGPDVELRLVGHGLLRTGQGTGKDRRPVERFAETVQHPPDLTHSARALHR